MKTSFKAGKLNEYGMFEVWIKGKQVFQIVGNCGGILEETIQKLDKNDDWRGVIMAVTDGPFKGMYSYTREEAMENTIWRSKKRPNTPAQRLFPLRDKYKIK